VFLKILLPAFGVGILGYFMAKMYLPASIPMRPAVVGFLAGMVPVIVFFVRLGLTAGPKEKAGLLALLPVYVAGGTFFMILHLNGSALTQWARDNTDRQARAVPAAMQQEALPGYYINAKESTPRPDPRGLVVVDQAATARMYGLKRMDESAVARIAAQPDVAVVAVDGASPRDLRDRATQVYPDGVVKVEESTGAHGEAIVSVSVPDGAEPLREVAFVRDIDGRSVPLFIIDTHLEHEIYGGYRERYGHDPTYLPPGQYLRVANSELYQSFNALFVVLGTPLIVAFFAWMIKRGRGISTARKLFIGLALTTLALLLMALAGLLSQNGAVKVSSFWLIGFYLIITIGELCLSPMGLSLVTKLSPSHLVGLTMGGWFLATAFGNNFSGFFGGIQHSMTPVAFFLLLAGLAGLSALFIFLLLPKLEEAIKQYGA